MPAIDFVEDAPEVDFQPNAPGMVEPGNINLSNRPRVTNPDGSISTVRSIGVNIDGNETLIPTVSDDGKILSNRDAIDLYKKTGKHLGKFRDVDSSNAYAQSLHEDQARMIDGIDFQPDEPSETDKAAKSLAETRGLIRSTREIQRDALARHPDLEANAIGFTEAMQEPVVSPETLTIGAAAVSRNLPSGFGPTLGPSAPGSARRGLEELAGEVGASLTSPVNAAALALTPVAPEVMLPYFGYQGFKDIPEAVAQAAEGETPADKVKGAGRALLDAGMVIPGLGELGVPLPRLPRRAPEMGKEVPLPPEATGQDVLASKARADYIAEQKAALELAQPVKEAPQPTNLSPEPTNSVSEPEVSAPQPETVKPVEAPVEVLPKVPNSIVVETPKGTRRVVVRADQGADGWRVGKITVHDDETGSYDIYHPPESRPFDSPEDAMLAGQALAREGLSASKSKLPELAAPKEPTPKAETEAQTPEPKGTHWGVFQDGEPYGAFANEGQARMVASGLSGKVEVKPVGEELAQPAIKKYKEQLSLADENKVVPLPTVPVESPKPKALSPSKASQDFDRLITEHGQQLGWVTRPDDLFAEIGKAQDTASIKAKLRKGEALKVARKNAARDLGVNLAEVDTATGRAKLLDQLKAHIEERNGKLDEDATEAAHRAAIDQEGQHADEDTSFLPEESKPLPKLRSGEKATGDLFQREDQPFNLMGEQATDAERIQAERVKAEKDKADAKAAQEKSQLEIIGMGGAVPGEFEGSKNFVSNMFAAIDRDRAAMGKDPMPDTQRRTWDEDNQKALARMNRDPQWIPSLIADVTKSPRPLLSWENAGMVWQRHLWKAEANNALARIAQAFDDGRVADLESAKLDAARYEDNLDALDKAVGRNGTGSEAGRSLQAQKMAGGEDFTLVEMRLQARKSKGGAPLTDAESAKIKELHDKIAANEKAIAEQNTRLAQLEMDKAAAEARARVPQEPSYSPGILAQAEKFVKKLEAGADESAKWLREHMGRTNLPGDPTILYHVTRLGAAKFARGAIELAKWTDAMAAEVGEWVRENAKEWFDASKKLHDETIGLIEKAQGKVFADKVKKAVTEIPERIKAAKDSIKDKASQGPQAIGGDVQKLFKAVVEQNPSMNARQLADVMHGILKESMPEITWQETIDAISGRGKFWRPSQEALAKNVRDKKAQLRLIGHQMDVEARKPLPRTGYQPDKMTDTARQEAQRLEELKRRYGVVVTNPATQLASALSARKTYYTHRLADLKAEIASRTRIVKTSAKVSDPALEALKAEYEKVKAEHNSIFDKELSDESKLKAATSAAERNLAEWNAKLEKAKRGDFSRDPAKPKLSTPELETIRAKAEAARNEVEHLKDLDTAFQEQKQVKALEDSIAEYERRIKENDLATPDKPGVSSPKVEALKAKRMALAGQLADLRASTPEVKAAKIEAARKAVQDSVDELSRQINEGDIAPEPKQPPKVTTPELEKMRAERDQLIKMKQKLQNAAKAKSPSEVEAKKLDDTQKQIEELARRINEGDIAAKAKASKPVSPALELLRGEREGLQKILAQLRNAAEPKKSPAEIAMQARKTAIAREIADLQERITKGDFSLKPRSKIVPDAALSALQTQKASLVKAFRKGLLEDELRNRTPWQRRAALFLRIRREMILSGISSIGKLFSYSAQEFALAPLKEAVGAGLSKLPFVRQVAERAPSEVSHRGIGSEVSGMIDDYVAAWTKGIKDAKDTWTGESELKAKYDPSIRAEAEFKAFFGTLHQMEKSPLIRFGFERSFRRRMEVAADRGDDVTDTAVQQRIGVDAYQDALRGALINRNAVVNRVNRFVQSLEEKSKVTGRSPALGTAAKFAFSSELPVQHVPANYVARTAEYVFGLGSGSVKLAGAFRRGIETLEPAEADQIMRHLKSGSVGSAAMLAGFLLPQLFGGLWTPGAKKNEKLHPGEIQAGPVKVRYWATHEQVLNAAQVGATVRKISEHKNQGLSAGAQAALWGLADEVPYARELSDFARAKDPRQTGKFWEEKAKGYLIPQGVSQAAELLDMNEQWRTVKRKPRGLIQTLETGIPGLRGNVPTN